MARAAALILLAVLSFGIPFALVPSLMLTRRRVIMGTFVNKPLTSAVAAGSATLIIGLNAFLLYDIYLA